MSAVIQHSSSINSAFISTVDHLPADLIRSLWLLQSINIATSKQKDVITGVLQRLQKLEEEGDKSQFIEELTNAFKIIEHFGKEATSEAKALYNHVATHRLSLIEELSQLKRLSETKLNDPQHSHQQELLRNQLIEHYKRNPLKSQKDAALRIQGNGVTKNNIKKSGIKLVLRIPKKLDKKKSGKPRTLGSSKMKKKSTKLVNDITHLNPIQDIPQVEPDNNLYCFCKQPSFGDMIGCDNEASCPNGDWFHYKCVGILNRVDALKYTTGKRKWFCSDYCRNVVEGSARTTKKKKSKRRRW